jgi:hypothetical protein
MNAKEIKKKLKISFPIHSCRLALALQIFGKNLYGVKSADFQAVCQNRQDLNVGGEKWLPTFLTPQVVVPSSSACISLLLYGGFIIEIRRHNFVLLFSL